MIDLVAGHSTAHSIVGFDETRPEVWISACNAAVARMDVMDRVDLVLQPHVVVPFLSVWGYW